VSNIGKLDRVNIVITCMCC